jgi:hypothetical protein
VAPLATYPLGVTNRSRSPWLAAAIALIGVAMLVVGASVLLLSRYQPLDTRSQSSIDAPDPVPAPVNYAGRRLQVVEYADGATVRYSFLLHNDGPVGVTVTGFALPSGPGRLFDPVGYAVGGRSLSDVAAGTARFHAFALPAGATRAVTVTLRFVNCQTISPRTGTNVETITVHYRGFGLVGRSQQVRLPDLLRVGSPSTDERCPGATATSRPPG